MADLSFRVEETIGEAVGEMLRAGVGSFGGGTVFTSPSERDSGDAVSYFGCSPGHRNVFSHSSYSRLPLLALEILLGVACPTSSHS